MSILSIEESLLIKRGKKGKKAKFESAVYESFAMWINWMASYDEKCDKKLSTVLSEEEIENKLVIVVLVLLLLSK